MRYPQVFSTTVSGGDTVAIIVNWREVVQSEFKFTFGDLGIVPAAGQSVKVTDLWTGEVVGVYDQSQEIGVQNIPGHGSFTYRFTLIDSVQQ